MGYKYCHGAYTLLELDRYYAAHSIDSCLTREAVEGWIAEKEAIQYTPCRSYISTVREFGRFLRGQGNAGAYVVSDKFVSRKRRPKPYFISEREIALFFNACGKSISCNRGKGRPLVLPAFFMLMHCCGLRTIEARNLLVTDVHLDRGVIDIMASKHHRSRRIFMNERATEYFLKYNEKISSVFPARLNFFPSTEKAGLSASGVGTNFNMIWNYAGLRKPSGKQPRPYDFRHHFAFANINRWTAEGRNVNAMLPYLMRYMGHGSLESTYYYVHLVPDFSAAYLQITKPLDEIVPEVSYES
jgi:integrase